MIELLYPKLIQTFDPDNVFRGCLDFTVGLTQEDIIGKVNEIINYLNGKSG